MSDSLQLCDDAVWHILPRGMRYERNRPTSIDLFVSEMQAHTRFETIVVAESGGPKLPANLVIDLPKFDVANTFQRARFVAKRVARHKPSIVIVQQHLPSAAAIASRIMQPTILQKHNFVRAPRVGALAALGRWRHVQQFRKLAGITFVSEAVQAHFEQHWPEVEIARCVVPNGIDLSAWTPQAERSRFVLVVGRASPDKGLLEAAKALAVILPKRPDWSACFVMSECQRNPAYAAAVRAALAPIAGQVRVLESVPASTVKQLNEQAAIALIPSVWAEPFGRTCLEAHAGGAAVLSSGSGGLREVSGEHAHYLAGVEPGVMAPAIAALMDDDALRISKVEAAHARMRALYDVGAVAARLDDFIELVGRKAGRRPRLLQNPKS